MKDLKIAHVGNLLNDAYCVVKPLRKMGYEMDIIMRSDDMIMYFPQWEDGEFDLGDIERKGPGYHNPIWPENMPAPDYFRFYTEEDKTFLNLGPTRTFTNFLDDLKDEGMHYFDGYIPGMVRPKNVLRLMKDYDFLFVWGEDVSFAPYTKKPFIACTYGSDIMKVPFRTFPLQLAMQARLQIKGYQKAKKVFITNTVFFHSAKKLGLKNTVYMPFAIDPGKYRPYSPERAQMIKDRFSAEKMIFNLSRLNWEVKANDKLVKAFSRLLKDKVKAKLVMSDWGPDREKTRELIRELGIQKHVTFVDMCSKKRLISYMSAADIITDQYKHSSFGTGGLEAMACQKPLVMYISEDDYRERYPEAPPVENALSVEEIHERLLHLCENEEYAQKVGKRSRNWVLKYHDAYKVGKKYIEYGEKALE